MNIFDHLNNLTINKKQYEENNEECIKSYNSYMINRFISMKEIYIDIVNEINIRSNIPKKNHYNYFLNILPKRKEFFKYIKNKTKNDINQNDKLNNFISYNKVGMNDWRNYAKFFNNEIEEIMEEY